VGAYACLVDGGWRGCLDSRMAQNALNCVALAGPHNV